MESGDKPVDVNFEFRAFIMDGDNSRGFQTGWENALFKGLVIVSFASTGERRSTKTFIGKGRKGLSIKRFKFKC